MRKLPPLTAVRAFEAAARHCNFTRAAEELGITQAGVSYQIKVLEDRVGMPLFTRAGRKTELTPAGAAIAPQIGEALSTIEAAFASLREDEQAVLSISAMQTFTSQFLAPRLGTFQVRNPQIAIRIDISDELVDLKAGEFDLAIRYSRRPDEDLVSHFLMAHTVAPMAHPDFLADNRIDTEADLEETLRISRDNYLWDVWFGRAEGERGRDDQGLQFDSLSLDAQAAMSGHGVAMLAPALFKDEIASGRLVQVCSRTARDSRSLWLTYAPLRRTSPKIRKFREWITQELHQLLENDPAELQPEG